MAIMTWNATLKNSDIIKQLDDRLALLPNKKQPHTCLTKVRVYLNKRQTKMDYQNLPEHDLEILSGAVEGAVNYVIAKRFAPESVSLKFSRFIVGY